MNAVFEQEGVPATLAEDRPRMLKAHARLDDMVAIASADADWLTRVVEGRMSGEHVSTTRTTYAGVLVAGVGIVLLAAPKGSPVDVCGHIRASAYCIRVLDRGVGIPEEMRTRIFEPFQSGRVNGTGLGLAVCTGIVRAHGGCISARAREGGGSEFVVELPRTQSEGGGHG